MRKPSNDWMLIGGAMFILSVALSGLILTTPDTFAKPRNVQKDPCIVLVDQLANTPEVVTFDEFDLMLHSIGCDQDEGGVYVKPTKQDNRCMRFAYSAARKQLNTTGRIDAGLIIARTTMQNCNRIDDDGTYKPD